MIPDSHETCIKKYFHEEIYHWDYDCAGDETHDFLFEDGKAYRLEYNYWSEWYREDEENGLKHAYRIFEIKSDDAKVPSRKPRDWILP